MLKRALGIIRVYTKEPNENKHSTEPFVLRTGFTVAELAKRNSYRNCMRTFDSQEFGVQPPNI